MNSVGELTFAENAAKTAQQWSRVEEIVKPRVENVLALGFT
jgi:hypothetical protein